MQKQDYYNDFFEIGQQKINFSFFELSLPDDDPVYTLKKVMEELDFSGLLANCSDKGFLRSKINFIFHRKKDPSQGRRLTNLVLAGILLIATGDVEMWY